MKYIFLNDLYTIFKKHKFMVLFYMIMIFLMTYLMFNSEEITNIDTFLYLFGLNTKIEEYKYVCLLIYIFNFTYILLIPFLLLDNDVKKGQCNIFMRINFRKWLGIKTLSILLTSFIMELIAFLLVYIIFFIKGIVFDGMLYYLYINIIFMSLITVSALIIYCILKRWQMLIPIVLTIALLYYEKLFIDVTAIEKYSYVGIILLPILIFILLLFNKKGTHIFE